MQGIHPWAVSQRQGQPARACMTFSPGRNMRLAGLGVVLVWMNMLRCC